MSANPIVQAVAEALWAGCDDKGISGRIHREDADYLAEVAVVTARPLIEREAKMAAWDEGYEAGWWARHFEDDEPTTNPYEQEGQ